MGLTAQTTDFMQALHQQHRSPQREYLRRRGLRDQTIHRFWLGYSAELNGIVIPYRAASGKIVMLKVRKLDSGRPKYLTLGHDFPLEYSLHLFNVQDAPKSGVVICEGEFDAMILSQEGIPAVAVPGTSSWQPVWGHLFGPRVTLLMDPDDAGLQAAHNIRKELKDKGTYAAIASLSDGDVTETYTRSGIDEIREAIRGAQ